MTLLMNFDFSAGSRSSLPFKCRRGSYYWPGGFSYPEGVFFLGFPAVMAYITRIGPDLYQEWPDQTLYLVESISYSKIASGHLNRASVVLAPVASVSWRGGGGGDYGRVSWGAL